VIGMRALPSETDGRLPAAVRVEPRLVELVDALPAAVDGVEIVVDCEPPRLAFAPERVERLARCARRLLDSALAGAEARQIDLCVRADYRGEAPMIYLSLRMVAADGHARRGAVTPGRARHERSLVRGSGKAILLSRREGDESRLTLALEMPFEVEAELPRTTVLATRVLVADDNARVRKVARRLLERRGFEVAEATGAIALLAELDPQRAGPAPDWVLVDEGWLRPADGAGRGLLTAIEAAVPVDRIVLLSGRRCRFGSRHRRLAKPFGDDQIQASLDDGSVPARNVEAERPYSLSL
jgi:CheY-like chemotaxis protein